VAIGADVLGVIAVIVGLAGSFAGRTLQVRAGRSAQFGIAPDLTASLTIIAVMFGAYMTSATTGLDTGIRILSNINVALAIGTMVFVLFAGPTQFLMETFVDTLGAYIAAPPTLSFRLFPNEDLTGRSAGWTLTCLTWWLAWNSLRRHLNRTHLPRAHDPGVLRRRDLRAGAVLGAVVRRVRGCRDLYRPAGAGRVATGPEGSPSHWLAMAMDAIATLAAVLVVELCGWRLDLAAELASARTEDILDPPGSLEGRLESSSEEMASVATRRVGSGAGVRSNSASPPSRRSGY
jgi:hypothetical protein